MLLSVSPGATTWTPEFTEPVVRGAPAGMVPGPVGTDEARRVAGGAPARGRCGRTRCMPGWTIAGLERLLASMIAASGTPCRREIISSVSPGATVIDVPP